MNETNLTQHGRSTDVNVSDILYPRDTKKILKKDGVYGAAFFRSRHATGGERACYMTRPNNGSEGDNSECCTNAVYFAYNYLNNKDNRPQKTCD